MAGIEIRGLTKVFHNRVRALDNVDLVVEDGELLVLVGPSGSGKTTLLRLVAGLDEPTAGTIRIDGKDAAGVPPHRRQVALVFQDLALYGHLTVADNLKFGSTEEQKSGKPKAESGGAERMRQVADMLGVDHLLDRYPAELSGGEQQRVALGRAIVRRPAALLLDEPLSSLDAPVRRGLRRELKRMQQQLGTPTIYVTHDQGEALALGDRIAVLDWGRLQQVGSPHDVYVRPASRFVAELFGHQGMNLLEGELKRIGGLTTFTSEGLTLQLPVDDAAGVSTGRVVCGFRPEDAEYDYESSAKSNWVVESCSLDGSITYVHLRPPQTASQQTTQITVCQPTFIPEYKPPPPGTPYPLRFRLDRLHWFDPITGIRL